MKAVSVKYKVSHYLFASLLFILPFPGFSQTPFTYDTLVYNITLDDEASYRKAFGDVNHRRTEIDDLPQTPFTSRDGMQNMAACFHPGSTRYQVSEFRVFYRGDKDKGYPVPADEFITNNGIKLGVTAAFVQTKLGRPSAEVVENGEVIYAYRVMSHPYLKRKNRAEYFATYHFYNNKLVKFSFGFVYE